MNDENELPPAEDPEQALAAVVALRAMAEKLERSAVRCAVEQGWTWEQVAQALGVTRQAAHKRHAARVKKSQEAKD